MTKNTSVSLINFKIEEGLSDLEAKDEDEFPRSKISKALKDFGKKPAFIIKKEE
jgi:phosphoenolpyruvate carboxylase